MLMLLVPRLYFGYQGLKVNFLLVYKFSSSGLLTRYGEQEIQG